ncbi:MAG: hypothetical protein ABI693_02080 [Bryobacteraceae bacterium]
MTLFDLVFLLLVLALAVSLITAAVMAMMGRWAAARRLLSRVAMVAAAYMVSVIVVSVALPRRVTAVGEARCFDDWCVAVEGFTKDAEMYGVDFRVSSRARRVSQRETNLSVYLTDAEGRRFEGRRVGEGPDFDVRLGPGESMVLKRAFVVPVAARDVGAVVTHEGGFPIGWFIIGYDTWFRQPAVTLLARHSL